MARTALLLGLMSLLAAAETPQPERKVLATIPGDWKGFKPGTWVESCISATGIELPATTTRMTLKESKKDGHDWISIWRTSEPAATAQDSPVDESWVSGDNVEPAGEEDLNVGDEALHCHVWNSKTGAKDGSTGCKFWICPESRELGGVVRMEVWEDKGSWKTSMVTKLAETGRMVDICGPKVRCFVIHSVETRDGKDLATTAVEEVTAIHLEGEDWAPAGKDEKK